MASAPAGGPFDGYTVDANALGWAYGRVLLISTSQLSLISRFRL